MSRKAHTKLPERTLDVVRAEVVEVEATQARLRQLIGGAMSAIRAGAAKVTKQVADSHGKVRTVKRINPAYAELRAFESTMKAVESHLKRLQAEMNELDADAAEALAEEDPYADFPKA